MKKCVLMLVIGLIYTFAAVAVSVPVAIQKSVTISWQGQIGKLYQVYQTTDLANWVAVDAAIIGDTNVITRSYVATNSSMFFKVEEVARPSLSHQLIYGQSLINMSLTQVSFNSDDIIFVDFSDSVMNLTDFGKATIDLSRFDGADLRNAFFVNCPYLCASFNGSILWNTLFNGSYLNECDFKNATFNYANPDFQGADVYFCDFTGATGFNPAGGHFVGCIMPDGSIRNDP